jgi:hypothetical protein
MCLKSDSLLQVPAQSVWRVAVSCEYKGAGILHKGENICLVGRTVLTTIRASGSVQLPCRSKKTRVSFNSTKHFTL